MAIIRVHRDPLKKTHDVFNVDETINLLHWLSNSAYKSMGKTGCIVSLNGTVIADSANHKDADQRCNIVISKHDQVDVIARAGEITTATALIIVAVALVASVVLLPKPKIPNDAGQSKQSPNNQLNAATNSYRPNQAIPNVYGEVVCFPDFIQRSFYVYENNRRVFTELFGVSLGRGIITEVKDGETLINSIQTSSYEIFGPGVMPTGLFDISPADASIDYPLQSPDLSVKVAEISGASFVGENGLITGLSGDALNDLLSPSPGDNIRIVVQYTNTEPEFPLYYDETREVLSVSGGTITFVTDPLKSFDDADNFSVSGALSNENESIVSEFFTLPGSSVTAVRFQIAMPSGIRNGLGTIDTVAYNLTVQQIDAIGDNIGSPMVRVGAFSGNTQDFLGRTEEFSGLTPGRYKARAIRLSDSLGDNASDRLVLERVESVTPYSTTFPDMTIIRTNRASSPQQSRGASEKINLLWQRELRIFDPNTGAFGAYAVTRSFAQAVIDVLVTRCGVALSDIDYETLFAIENGLVDPRLGYFDFSFDDSDVSAKQYVQTICNVARVSAYEIASGNWRFVRDELKSARVALFNRSNLVPGASKISGKFQRGLDFDSVEVSYVDPGLNTNAFIRKRINPTTGAIENDLGVRVQKMELAGCRNEYQAENRAQREIGRIRYQRTTVADRVNMDAIALGIGERVGWGYIADKKIFTGEIRAQSGNIFTTSEKFLPEVGESYFVYITNDDGSTSNTVACVARSDGNEFGFEAAGLAAFTADGVGVQVGSNYLIAADTEAHDFIITKRGKPSQDKASWGQVDVELANYDERAYPAE